MTRKAVRVCNGNRRILFGDYFLSPFRLHVPRCANRSYQIRNGRNFRGRSIHAPSSQHVKGEARSNVFRWFGGWCDLIFFVILLGIWADNPIIIVARIVAYENRKKKNTTSTRNCFCRRTIFMVALNAPRKSNHDIVGNESDSHSHQKTRLIALAMESGEWTWRADVGP